MRLFGLMLFAIAGSISCLAANPQPSGLSPLTLTPCHLERLAEEVLCGTHEVFEDRTAGSGRRLTIQVAVMPALRRSKAPDPLYILAGGPGQGARGFAPAAARFFKRIRRTRDIVLVDLRGTGGSAPLACPRPDDELTTISAVLLLADVARCRAELQADPRHYTHAEALADLDEIRQRLDHRQVNLWGGSWGTRAALLYTITYPHAVRSVVLDGAVSLSMEFPRTVALVAERAFDALLQACAADATCVGAFPNGRTLLTDALEKLPRGGPVSTRHPRTGAPVTLTVPREAATEIVRVALYTPTDSARLFAILRHAADGDMAPLLAQLLLSASWSTDDMALGQTMAILCSEDLPLVAGADFSRDAAGTFAGSSYADAWRDRCREWPRGKAMAVNRDATTPVPALILSGAHDPVTPPAAGEAMGRHFPNYLHIVVPGAAHNASFSGCVPDLIAAFIAQGSAAPRSGARQRWTSEAEPYPPAGFLSAVRGGASLDTACASRVAWPPAVVGDAGTTP